MRYLLFTQKRIESVHPFARAKLLISTVQINISLVLAGAQIEIQTLHSSASPLVDGYPFAIEYAINGLRLGHVPQLHILIIIIRNKYT